MKLLVFPPSANSRKVMMAKAHLGERDWLSGPAMTTADISVAAIVRPF